MEIFYKYRGKTNITNKVVIMTHFILITLNPLVQLGRTKEYIAFPVLKLAYQHFSYQVFNQCQYIPD